METQFKLDQQVITVLEKVKALMNKQSSNLFRLSMIGNEEKIKNIQRYFHDATENRWNEIKRYVVGRYKIYELADKLFGETKVPTPEELLEVLKYGTSNMKIIRVNEQGRMFEAFVKALIVEPETEKDKRLIGLAIAGNLTACRAIHASLYNEREIVIVDALTGEETKYVSSYYYRKVEEINGKVCHMFMLPRLALTEEYMDECMIADKNNSPHPDRILMAREGNIEELAGQFLASKYSLPRTRDWADQYLGLLPEDKWVELELIRTDLAVGLEKLRAVLIRSMKEEEVLRIIDEAIVSGILNVHTEIGERAILNEGMTAEEYLRANAEVLATKIDKHMKPLYDGKTYSPYLGMTKRISVPSQARAVMGTLNVLKRYNNANLVGDMGTGKTQMALSTCYAMMRERQNSGAQDGLRVLIVAPAITIPKWATSEIPEILGTSFVSINVLESTEDALRYVRKVRAGHRVPKGHIEFVLVSTDRMKLTANKFVLGAIWDDRKQVWRCPDCGNALISPKAKENEKDLFVTWHDVVESPKVPPFRSEIIEAKKEGRLAPNGLPKGYIKRYTNRIRQMDCKCHKRAEGKSHCSLARPALKERGEDNTKRRWMIAQIFQRALKKHFHLGIFDEIQMMKASDSGRGLSFHKLLKSCKKTLMLTGTLTNGASSSIQATLWRTNPKALLEEGFKHNTSKELWAAKYGVIEKVTYRDEKDGVVGRNTNRRTERVIVKEKPGIAPQMVARHLLHNSIFIELSDIGLPLVQLNEEPCIIELDEEHAAAYRAFHDELYDTCRKLQVDLGSKAWARFNPATLNYAAQPQLGQVVEFTDDDGNLIGKVVAPKFPEDYETALERQLVEDVKQELKENRGCIIYTYFTGVYKTNERLQKVLAKHGIQSEILDVNTTTSMGRFEWLEKQKQKGSKVLIMSSTLVQVGLDLLDWPTLLYWQMHDDINVVRQAGKRAHRIGQHRECRVKFYVADGTQQKVQFQRLMSRRINALLVEGRIERSDALARYAQDSGSNLTRDLASCLSATELTNTWKSAAEKDIDQNIVMVSEAEYQKAIAEAFERLTNETKRLCGVQHLEPLVSHESQMEKDMKEFLESDVLEGDNLKHDVITPKVEVTGQISIFDFELKIDTVKTKVKRGQKPEIDHEQIAFDF
jgi:hypothetical protein